MAEAFDNSGASDDSADDEEGPLSLGQARQKPLDYVASSGASAQVRNARKRAAVSSATLPKELQDDLRRHVGGARVEQLPLFAENKATRAKDRAGSTLASARKAWLQSPAGQEWFKEMQARWNVE